MLFHAYYSRESQMRHPEGLRVDDGTEVGAIHIMAQVFGRFIRDVQPSYVAAAFDCGRTTFRTEMYPLYKSNREETPEDLRPQFPLAPQLLQAMGCTCFQMPGFEADDIMATVAKWAHSRLMNVVIVSQDKDMLQMIKPGIHVMHPRTLELVGEDDVLQRFGVTPTLLPELSALMGDRIDNIPGVKGLGVKGGAALLGKYKSLDGIYSQIHTVQDSGIRSAAKIKDALLTFKDDVYLFKRLSQLKDDVSLPDLDAINTQALRYRGLAPKAYEFLGKYKITGVQRIINSPPLAQARNPNPNPNREEGED